MLTVQFTLHRHTITHSTLHLGTFNYTLTNHVGQLCGPSHHLDGLERVRGPIAGPGRTAGKLDVLEFGWGKFLTFVRHAATDTDGSITSVVRGAPAPVFAPGQVFC